MTEWNYIVILLSILLLIFLLWKEVKRKNKQRLPWRLLTTILAAGSLASMAFPLYYVKDTHNGATNEAIIITEGYNKDSINHFLAANHTNYPVFTLSRNADFYKKFDGQYVADTSLLTQQNKDIRTFHVFGFGLSKEEIKALPKAAFIFHPSTLPSGITAINWQQKIKQGEKLIVQGKCNNIHSSNIKIVLSSFNTTLDSATVSENKNKLFTLSVIPKGEGRLIYTLSVISNKDTIEKETIPVQVEEGLLLKILMLTSSPDFDNKFLQNSLSKNKYEVAVRTAISKNKYVYDYLNMPAVSLDHITSSLLDKFTVLIADASALATLPKPELAIIQAQVAQRSLGLVIKADSVVPLSFYASPFPLLSAAKDTQQQLTTYLLDTTSKLPALTVDYSISIKNESNTQPMVFDKQNKLYVNSALYGSGKIVFTTLFNTYTWALAGNEEAYNRFWSTLLNKAVAQPQSDEAWSISPALPFINTPVQLQLQTNNAELPQGQINGTPVYLGGNSGLPYQWSGNYYPAKKGWQTGIDLQGKPFYWYAYNTADWQNVVASQKIIATQQFISSNLYSTEKKASADQLEKTEFPTIYLFLLFLLCCGFLWAESKGLFSVLT